MTIPWTKCSERMPPDEYGYEIILNCITHYSIEKSHSLHDLVSIRVDLSELSWIPFDEATWQELNR